MTVVKEEKKQPPYKKHFSYRDYDPLFDSYESLSANIVFLILTVASAPFAGWPDLHCGLNPKIHTESVLPLSGTEHRICSDPSSQGTRRLAEGKLKCPFLRDPV